MSTKGLRPPVYLQIEDGAVVLPAARTLANLPAGTPSRHESLRRRHPTASYSASVGTVGAALAIVLSLLEAGRDWSAEPSAKARHDQLLFAYEGLLHALMNHMEDCVWILKSLTRQPDLKHDPAAKRYKIEVDDYRNHIGNVVNAIKHRQGRLRLLQMLGPQFASSGYYVERGAGDGVGPDPDVHARGLTAFSFNRDLKLHVCEFLQTSASLASAVETMLKIAPAADHQGGRNQLLEQVSAVSRLEEQYFPDEYEKPRPDLFVTADVMSIRAGFVSSEGWQPFAGLRVQINMHMVGDDHTREWKVPYADISSLAQQRPRVRESKD
jgi:hypothetical protein